MSQRAQVTLTLTLTLSPSGVSFSVENLPFVNSFLTHFNLFIGQAAESRAASLEAELAAARETDRESPTGTG